MSKLVIPNGISAKDFTVNGNDQPTEITAFNTLGQIDHWVAATTNDFVTGSAAGDGGLRVNTGQKMMFGVGTTEIMRLNSDGGLQMPGSTSAVSAANTGRIRYNSSTNHFELSENGAAYSQISAGGSMAIGGTVSSGTAGSVLFVATGPVLQQDNANFFYDNTNHRLGLGTTSPQAQFHVVHATQPIMALAVNATDVNRRFDAIDGTFKEARIISGDTTAGAVTIIASGTSGKFSVWTNNAAVEQFDILPSGRAAFGVPQGAPAAGINARLHVAGGAGDTTVPTIMISGSGNTGSLNMQAGQSAAVSAASTGSLRYNASTQHFEISENGGAYTQVGTGTGTLTGSGLVNGQVAFATTSTNLSSDSALFWDNTNKRLGVGTNSPQRFLHVTSAEAGANGLLIRLEKTGTSPRQWDINTKSGALVIGDNTASADRWSLDTAGNMTLSTAGVSYSVGLGTLSSLSDTTFALHQSSPTADFHITQRAFAAGATFGKVDFGAHGPIAAGVETIDWTWNLNRTVTWATGTLALQRFMVLQPPTIAFSAASTATDAITLDVSAPAAGTNATITNQYAIRCNTGSLKITTGFVDLGAGSTLAVSASSRGRLRYNESTNHFEISENGSAYSQVSTFSGLSGGVNNTITKWTSTTTIGNSAWTDNGTTTTYTQVAASSGNVSALTVVGAANTGQTATVESIDINFNLARTVTFSGNNTTLAAQRAALFQAPTIAGTNNNTFTEAATLAVSGAPVAGTQAHLTNTYAFWVQGGRTQFAGSVNITAAAANSNGTTTGTGATVFSMTGTNTTTGTTATNYLVNWTQAAFDENAQGQASIWVLNGGAISRNLTSQVTDEVPDIVWNLNRTVEFSNGNTHLQTNQRAFIINPPTYAFRTTAGTLTNAAVIAITGAPVQGTNCTITNAYSLWVQAGKVQFDGGMGLTGAAALITMTQSAATTGSPTGFSFTAGAHTTLTASTEAIDVLWSLNRTVQFNTGALTTQRAFYIRKPTYAFVAASTLTTATTLEIENAPAQGTNATITNAFAINIAAGAIGLAGSAGTSGQVLTSGGPNASCTWTSGITGTGTANTIVKYTGTSTIGNSSISDTGTDVTITQTVATSGTHSSLTITAAAHTTQAAGVEETDVNFNLARTVQFATGAITTQRAARISAPTYGFVASSTITNAATFAITGAPVAGTNATITNAYSLWCQAGLAQFDGSVALSGAGNTGFAAFAAGQSAAVSASSTGRIIYDATAQHFKISENGGAYTQVVVGTGTANTLTKFTAANTVGNSGITDDGTTVTTSENVVMNGNVTLGASVASVLANNGYFSQDIKLNASGVIQIQKIQATGAVDGSNFNILGQLGGTGGGNGGYLQCFAGDATGTNKNGGFLIWDAGNKTGAGVAGKIQIGPTVASAVEIGRAGINTAITGRLSLKDHAAFTGSEVFHSTGAVQTTDATQTTAFTFTLSDTTLYWFEATIEGRDTSGTDRALYTKKALVYREGGGATIQGSVVAIHADIETNAAWDATFTVSGNNLLVSVTGAAATTVNWVCKINFQAVSSNT